MSELAVGSARTERSSLMSTGPSGLVLGQGPAGPVTMRLFRMQPTRVFMSAPEYVTWLIAFRAVCLGAHLSVLTLEQRRWLPLADVIRTCGGTVDILHGIENLPGAGRPYRPSLVIDEVGAVTPQTRIGAWQALITAGNPSTGKSVSEMRNSDLTVLAPVEGRAADNLRRAYALTQTQMKPTQTMGETDVVLASVRRLVKVPVPPSPTEYRMLFGG